MALTAEIVAEIVERTDGVPLFVEELTKAVLESAGQSDRVTAVLGAASLAAQSVPATLHASLMARLDRLGPVPKETAQIGAVLGREFSYELIELVAQHPEKKLQAALRQLSDAGLLPESADRNECDIDLQLALAGCLLTAKGAVAAKLPYRRAFDLADSSGSPQQRFDALYGVWQSTNMSGGSAAPARSRAIA